MKFAGLLSLIGSAAAFTTPAAPAFKSTTALSETKVCQVCNKLHEELMSIIFFVPCTDTLDNLNRFSLSTSYT